jgi:hypothetical protein
MRRIRSPCCARAASGHAAAPPSSVMKARRFTAQFSRASDRKDSTPRWSNQQWVLSDAVEARRMRFVGDQNPIRRFVLLAAAFIAASGCVKLSPLRSSCITALGQADWASLLADPPIRSDVIVATFMKPAQLSLVSALVAMCFPCQAHAQWTGTYEYTYKGFSGKMVVTDVSPCELEKSLGCLAAVRPLIIDLSTTDKIRGGKCAVKSTENPSARIGYQNKISASFPLDAAEGKSAPWIDIEFRKGGALVKLGRTEMPVGACEGTGRFVGTWRKTAD